MPPIHVPVLLAIIALLTLGCGDDGRSSGGSGGPSNPNGAACSLEDDPDCPLDCAFEQQWPAEWLDAAEEVVELINQLRAAGATCGDTQMPPAGPLRIDPALMAASRCHSLDMGEHGELTHTGSDGSSFSQRAIDAGYEGSPRAENAAAGYGTPEATVNGWATSPGHCRNMMAGDSNDVGIGLSVVDGGPYATWWTAKFGRR